MLNILPKSSHARKEPPPPPPFSLDLEYHLSMYIECVTKRMSSRGSYFVLSVKMNSGMNRMYYLDAAHITVFRKYVNIITSTAQNISNALSRVKTADDEESLIQLSRFLNRVFDMRNRGVRSE